MAYFRINMVEFDSPEVMEENAKALNENAGEIFPEVQLIAAIATSDTSALSISLTSISLPSSELEKLCNPSYGSSFPKLLGSGGIHCAR